MNYDDKVQNVGIVLPKPIAIALKVIWIIISIPFIIVLFFIMISSGKEFINYSILHSNYINTSATLVDYTKCDIFSDVEWCYGVYEFDTDLGKQQIVDSTNYTKENIKDNINIKYNSEKPTEFIVTNYADKSLVTFLLSLGGIIVILFSIGKVTLSFGKYSITKY